MTSIERCSWLDRTLHRVAFAQIEAQQGLSALEDRMFANAGFDRAAFRYVNKPLF